METKWETGKIPWGMLRYCIRRSYEHKIPWNLNLRGTPSWREGDINPLADKFQWVAKPFLQKNMPKVAVDAKKHVSLRAITTETERGRVHILDAEGLSVEHLSVRISGLLQGKFKVNYSPQLIHGDTVIVVNAINQVYPGHTWDTKVYKFYRNRKSDPRGPKIISAKSMMCLNPSMVINMAVKGMLAKNFHRNVLLRRLYVYPGAIHPHWGIPQVVIPADTSCALSADIIPRSKTCPFTIY